MNIRWNADFCRCLSLHAIVGNALLEVLEVLNLDSLGVSQLSSNNKLRRRKAVLVHGRADDLALNVDTIQVLNRR